MMRRALIALAIFLVLLVAPLALRYFNFYGVQSSSHTAPSVYEPQEVVNLVPTPASSSFVDSATPAAGDHLVLLDMNHKNNFTLKEIGYLDGRLAARGAEFVSYEGDDLASALRRADSFVVMTPMLAFAEEEIKAVTDFVSRGGRLLLIGDPSRFEVSYLEDDFGFITGISVDNDKIPLNSLANTFGIIFNGDYLYNTVENEGNFRNIILQGSSLGSADITDGLDKLAFYGSHSLQVGRAGTALLLGGDDTWSSATDRPGGLALGASSHEGQVLAFGDIHFMTEPYHTVFDNQAFIAGIADFLVQPAGREFILTDFPYFYSENVDLIFTGQPDLGPNAFDEIINLQSSFRLADRDLSLVSEANEGHDSLYLGVYNQTDEVSEILASAGISLTIQPPILTDDEIKATEEMDEGEDTEDTETGDDEPADDEEMDEEDEETLHQIQAMMGNIQMSGTGLILLQEEDGQRQVVVLAASSEGLTMTMNRLLDLTPVDGFNALNDCLLQDYLALCPTYISDEEVEAELLTGGVPEDMNSEEPTDEPTDDPTDEPTDTPTDGDPNYEAIGAIYQGTIGLGDVVENTLGAEEKHGWTYSTSSFVNITLEPDGDLDMVLEIYDVNGDLVRSVDGGFTGEAEQIFGLEVPADTAYAIVVYEFFGAEGNYSLSVSESDVQGGIFIYVDDDDTPLSDGYTSVDAFVELLASDHNVTTWVASENEDLTLEDLAGYEMLIWTSGDYQTASFFDSPDISLLLETFLFSEGRVLITGATPALFSDNEIATLSDLEVGVGDSPLLEGLPVGEVITLDQSYETAVLPLEDIDEASGDMLLFLRGSASDSAGLGAAIAAEPDGGSKIVLLAVPFVALPADIQAQFLMNTMNWFELVP